MKTPNQTIDELTHFNLFIELWNDEELREAIKSVSQKNEIKESVLKLKPLFDEMVSDLFEGYFLAAKKDVEKWIDVWENKEFLPTDEVNENLKYWRESLKNDRQYNYFLNSVKSGWVRDNSPMNSKAELIKNANSVFYSGVRLMHENGSCAKAEPTLEDHYNLAITFVKDNCRWVYHHAKITTINKYLSGKLSNEPTAKAKPKKKVFTIEDYLSPEGLKNKERINERIKAAQNPKYLHNVLIAAHKLEYLNFDIKKHNYQGTQEDFHKVLLGINPKLGTRQNTVGQTKKLAEEYYSANPGKNEGLINREIQELKP
jgi:hypothetical protein